jgi:predicted extracellular nuclease
VPYQEERAVKRIAAGIVVLLLLTLFFPQIQTVPIAEAVSPNVVISQVYGGGGNTGATYTHDFIELFNRGNTTVNLSGWSLQYASATGSGNFGATSTQLTELSGSIAPGRYLLVQEAQGASGTTPLPSPDIVDPSPIAMAAGAGKVALVTGTDSLGCNGSAGQPCSAAQLARIIDLVGYGNANFFEGASPAPTLSNTTAAIRGNAGCTDTDNNGADFAAAGPNPRNSSTAANLCSAEAAPSVSSTSPTNGASNVAPNANITINFSEPVNVSGTWYSISCTVSGGHPAASSGGPQSFTLDPTIDFAYGETCTVTILASQVTDQDTNDPPDNMASNHVFSFSTEPLAAEIHDVQGAAHISPLVGRQVLVEGIVTAKASNGFWFQSTSPDSDVATSEGLFVFGTAAAGLVVVGDGVQVRGTVTEFRPGGATQPNLTTTELTSPFVTKLSSSSPLPPATVIGSGGRVPPTMVIADDAVGGSVENAGSVFDPANDGVDFYESLEGMRVQINNAVAVGPRNAFGEIALLADDGAGASVGVRTARGGIVIRSNDFNPERIILDDVLTPTPVVKVGDHFTGPVVGVMDYSFGNFKLLITSPLTGVDGGLAREVGRLPTDHEVVVGTYNVENLDPSDGDAAFQRHASLIVNNLRSPDILAIEEIQDNDGATNSIVTDASVTWNMLIAAIKAAGGPDYQYRQIDPLDDQDGGQPGGNIRVGFLFRTDRGVEFIDRPGGTPTTPTLVVQTPSGPQLSASPGRIDPDNSAWFESRKPIAGEFRARGRKLFVIANHWSSKGGDHPLFGRFQPPVLSSEVQRKAQAQVVRSFVDELLDADPNANIIVLGDLNDFEFSPPLTILKGAGTLHTLVETLAQNERYSYVFDGNSQVLDQIVVSTNLFSNFGFVYDVIHVNAEFPDQASDHEPSVVRLDLRGRPRP